MRTSRARCAATATSTCRPPPCTKPAAGCDCRSTTNSTGQSGCTSSTSITQNWPRCSSGRCSRRRRLHGRLRGQLRNRVRNRRRARLHARLHIRGPGRKSPANPRRLPIRVSPSIKRRAQRNPVKPNPPRQRSADAQPHPPPPPPRWRLPSSSITSIFMRTCASSRATPRLAGMRPAMTWPVWNLRRAF